MQPRADPNPPTWYLLNRNLLIHRTSFKRLLRWRLAHEKVPLCHSQRAAPSAPPCGDSFLCRTAQAPLASLTSFSNIAFPALSFHICLD